MFRYSHLWLIVFGWLFKHHLDVWIDQFGITFYYKGDEVCWEWPHKRRMNCKYYDLNLNQHFTTLKEIDELWGHLSRMHDVK